MPVSKIKYSINAPTIYPLTENVSLIINVTKFKGFAMIVRKTSAVSKTIQRINVHRENVHVSFAALRVERRV